MSKITKVHFTGRWQTVVFAELEDGSEVKLFAFYADEISFSEAELVGLTVAEARILRHKKDVAYLRS